MKDPKEYLCGIDPVLGAVIEQTELPERTPPKNHFYALARAIIRQQLSGKAADAIERRFVALFSARKSFFPTPQNILAMPAERMRSSGLSHAKISYLKNLATAVADKTLDFKRLDALSDDNVIALLTTIKGIGRWTAEMFLMFALDRPDVFSYADLGLRNAMTRLYRLRAHPSRARAEKISCPWRPYRTLACRYLLASLNMNA